MAAQDQSKPAAVFGARPVPSGARRRILVQVFGSASSLLLVGIVLMANYLSYRHYARFDWTSQALFTLSGKSKAVLRELNEDVDIYLFLSPNEPSFSDTEELLKRYQAASPRVRVHRIDPDREPAKFKLLAQRFGLGAALLETGEFGVDVAAMVTAGQSQWSVKRDDLVDFSAAEPGQEGQMKVDVKAEQAITGAIVQVTGGRPIKLCLTKGHGEWPLSGGDERSLSVLKEAMRHDNIVWEEIDLLGKKSLPEGCDAVLVAGPQSAFPAGEAGLIGDWVRRGGKALLAFDPVIERDRIQPTGFEEMARGFGISIDPALVVELNRAQLVSPNAVEFLVTDFGDHETTRALQHRGRVLMSLARGVRPTQGSDAEILMRSSAEAFGETEISQVRPGAEPQKGPGDLPGPVSIGAAVQAPPAGGSGNAANKPGGRLIVIGDSDWLQGALLGSPELANLHLAGACIGWITARKALVEIPPKKAGGSSMVFTQEDLSALLFRVVVLLPAAVLILGVVVWIKRRS